MDERIASYNTELDNISLVLDKLLGKQNSSVFDKLCVKCDNLFMNVAAIDPKEITPEERKSIIGVLKRLLGICQKLKNYRDYLVSVITQNIARFEQENETLNNEPVTPINENAQITNKPNILSLQNQESKAA